MARGAQRNTGGDTPVNEQPKVDEPTVDEPTVDEPTVDEPTVDEPTYKVATGKSITTKRGVKGEGEVVEADHLQGGQDTLDNLVTRGLITKG